MLTNFFLEEVPDDAPIADKIKKGVTLENVYIMNELSGMVLDVAGGECEPGTIVCKLHQFSIFPQ